MPSSSIEFGYFPYECDIQIGSLAVSTLPGLASKVAQLATSGLIHDDWIYAPPRQTRNAFAGTTATLPYASRIFGLPKTHILTHVDTASSEQLRFLVWCFGFFVGMRLTVDEAGFLDSTPVRRGKLSDFHLDQGQLPLAMSLADSFWQANSSYPRRTKRVEGIIHCLFLAQGPQLLEFERFINLYTALDACYALMESIQPPGKKVFHSGRVDWMCQQYNMPTPSWAIQSPLGSEVSAIRNDALHEGLFIHEPLGFSIYGGSVGPSARNVPLEMQGLVSRLLVASLGRPKCNYVHSDVDSRQRYRVDLS